MENWFANLFKRSDKKSFKQDYNHYLTHGSQTKSGASVSSSTAMRVTTVYACVRVISESVGQLPTQVMKKNPDGSKTQAESHNIWRLFNQAPNAWMTPFEFKEMMTAHCLLRGNAYAYKTKAADGRILELLPLHPDSVSVEQLSDYTLRYTINLANNRSIVANADEIFHLRGLTNNGYLGLNPIALHREAIGLAMQTEAHGAMTFGNGAKVGGILSTPNTLSKAAQERIKLSWEEAFTGGNAYRTAVLEEGMSWQQMGMSNDDSQFLETRQFQRSEIASIFRVPPHKIGDLARSTNNNIEHQALEFVQDTLKPWVIRWQEAIQRDLMPQRDRNNHVVRFQLAELLRGDLQSRYQAYATGIQWGILSPNDAREAENLNKREDGDVYLAPLNMVPSHLLEEEVLARISQPEKDQEAADADREAQEESDEQDKEFEKQYLKALTDLND